MTCVFLISLGIAFPSLSLFIPVVVFTGLFVSVGWSLALGMALGLWLDSLYGNGILLPFTMILVLSGVVLEFLQTTSIQKQFLLGLYYVIGITFLLAVLTILFGFFHWLMVFKLVVAVVVNCIAYYVLFTIWKKLSRQYV